jgi:hypothetical protein
MYIPLYVMRTHICSYANPTIEAWLLAHPNTPSFRLILNPFPYNEMYSFWYTTSYGCTSFMMSMWLHHRWFGYLLSLLLWKLNQLSYKYKNFKKQLDNLKYEHCKISFSLYKGVFPYFTSPFFLHHFMMASYLDKWYFCKLKNYSSLSIFFIHYIILKCGILTNF